MYSACHVCQIRQRVMQILSIRGGSIKAIKSIMRGEAIFFSEYFLNTSRIICITPAVAGEVVVLSCVCYNVAALRC